MNAIKIKGVGYESRPKESRCKGCAGQHRASVCLAFPVGCSDEDIIWVEAPKQELPVQMLCPEIKPKIIIQIDSDGVQSVASNFEVEVLLYQPELNPNLQAFAQACVGCNPQVLRNL